MFKEYNELKNEIQELKEENIILKDQLKFYEDRQQEVKRQFENTLNTKLEWERSIYKEKLNKLQNIEDVLEGYKNFLKECFTKGIVITNNEILYHDFTQDINNLLKLEDYVKNVVIDK